MLWCSFSIALALETTVWRNLCARLGRCEREELAPGTDKCLTSFGDPQLLPGCWMRVGAKTGVWRIIPQD